MLRKAALRVEQNGRHPLYLMSLTARELHAVADISRINRDDSGTLLGYQRGEVRRHVRDIVEYLDGDDVLFPNSIIISLTSRVRFEPGHGACGSDGASTGTICIPLPGDGEARPGWIVDGQQRALALMQSKRADWPVPVNAFIADEVSLQRDQFLRVNNTKPLPRGLICELLPEVSGPLPRKLAGRRLPSSLCDLLDRERSSPFRGLIRRTSQADRQAKSTVVADASLIMMLEESIGTPAGCLFPYHNISTGECDLDGIWSILVAYWSAVRESFPEAWGKPPSRSRLMHGTGIRAMGRLMDRVMAGFHPGERNLRKRIEQELRPVVPICRWTSGRWEELQLEWREIQNVPQHLRLLSNLLVRAYLRGRGGAA
ncbi:DGQHR domain-containing protein DpdB [Tautonia plasticadhaerens]|uniref:DGQHR domain-containing protein DpdB n=1 Tax=Tautonia plasticadhaerens TaxID=2527974 RepID=UPI0018D214E6|nr:DGQHR domain-containing protein DpdB [Tautonia plasticadhaerens]